MGIFSAKNSVIARVLKYYSGYWPYIIIGIVGLLMTSASTLSIGRILENLVNSKSSMEYLSGSFGRISLLVFALAAGSFIRNFMINYYTEKAIWKLGADVYRHTLSLSADCFNKISRQDIILRFSSDMNLVLSNLGNNFSFAVRNLVTLVGSMALIIYSSWVMSLYILSLVPVLYVCMAYGRRLIRKASQCSQESVANVLSHITETIKEMWVVQAFCQEDKAIREFSNSQDAVLLASKRRLMVRSCFIGTMIMMSFAFLGALTFIGNHYVAIDQVTRGAMASFTFYGVLGVTGFSGLVEAIGDLERSLGACARLFDVMDLKSVVLPVDSSNVNVETGPGKRIDKICFKDVSFGYPDSENKVIENISFTIRRGESITIIGGTGAGKSTLCALLLRFYDVSSGEITIDDVSIRDMPLGYLRGLFGYVPSEPALFSRSILQNIAYGTQDASTDDINEATRVAAIDSYIDSLPEGLDHIVGSNGSLSSGQKQRIAIARAVLKKPSIILFDEASSALDYETEAKIKQSIDSLLGDTIKIFITHRLQALRPTDIVLVLEGGRIESFGKYGDVQESSNVCLRLLSGVINGQ